MISYFLVLTFQFQKPSKDFELPESSCKLDSFSDATSSSLDFVTASSNTSIFVNPKMLNSLVRDLAFPKYKAEILGSCLKQLILLEKRSGILWFRHLNKKFHSFFDSYNGLRLYKDVDDLMMELDVKTS